MIIRPTHAVVSSLMALSITLTGCASSSMNATPANIVAAANAQPSLSTFTQLIKQSGLEQTLTSGGPITVFAPSDEAFKALPPAVLDKLSKDPTHLKAVLNYHMLPGLMKSADLDGSKQATTINGAKTIISKAGDFVTIDDALVTQSDIASGNGIIHVIDRVLTPPKK